MLTAAQREELERRLKEDEANPGDAVSWEGAKAQVLLRLRSDGNAAMEEQT